MNKRYPILYPKTETAFTNNGLGYITDGIRCEVSEQINNELELVLEYPVAGSLFKYMKLNNIIYSPISPYNANYQPFRIYLISKPMAGNITVKAEHRSYELRYYPCMPNGDHVQTPGSCAGFMQFLTLEAARTAGVLNTPAYTFSTDISDAETWAITTITDIKSAMAYAVKVFGGEWEYNGTHCTLKQRRGANRGVKVQYSTNLVDIQQTQKDVTYSDLLPYWTDGTEYVYIDDDSPYLPIPTAGGISLNAGIKPLNLSKEFAEKPSSADLLAKAILSDEYKSAPKPEVTQNVSFVPRGQTTEYAYLYDTDHVELGDYVQVENKILDISLTERCNKIVYNVYMGMYSTCTVGEVKKDITVTIAKQDTTNNEPYVWVSTTAPTNGHKTGDYWIKIDDTTTRQAQQLGRFTGSNWQLMCEFNNGGGVGENIGRHNERFNDYENNTMSPDNYGDYNKLSGYSNTIGAGNCHSGDVGGYGNTLSGLNTSVFLRGYHNTVTGGLGVMVGGEGNTVSGGEGLTVGHNNTAQGHGITFGDYCSNTHDHALVGGNYGFSGSNFKIAIGGGGSSSNPKNVFTVSNTGVVTASDYQTSNADFAEYFEWADGNPHADDRMGLLVEQIGDKIAPAQGTEFFGAISARASVIGNAYEDYWHGKYITDVYGRIQYDKDGRALISPDFDPSRVYVPRSQRPEWAVTGLVGRIIVRDDGSCKPGGYVSARQGIATSCYSKTAAKVLRRVDKNHIEVILK